MAKQATQKATQQNWARFLWPALGLGGVGATVYVAREQLSDPESLPNAVASRIKAGLREANTKMGAAMDQIVAQMRSKLQPPCPPPMQLPSPASIPGHTASWLADWCEGSPERAEVAITLGGAPLVSWLLDLTCSTTEELLDTSHPPSHTDGSSGSSGGLPV
uniref:Uncharacterized protein n=1 Tax=Chlamydomonas leiostraca TaxID=1034604 RepID=A0A7S0S1V3_9CHLO|mmetsp:Transcript_4998/g.12290  ORF Transcript_4998/g.12290 Transcript_4998/m.12290 type:complete len:162 (+) Transcript_4998:92-577(+)